LEKSGIIKIAFKIKKMKNKILGGLFFLTVSLVPQIASAEWSIESVQDFGLPEGSIAGIIVGILQWILTGFGIIGVIGFLIAGILYIVSAGDKDTMERAKRAMLYSFYGVIVGISGLVIIQAVDFALNAMPF
jgi:hypothetical protein